MARTGPKGVDVPQPSKSAKASLSFTLTEMLNLLRAIRSESQVKVSDLASQFNTTPESILALAHELHLTGVPPQQPHDFLDVQVFHENGAQWLKLNTFKVLSDAIRLTQGELYALKLALERWSATARDDDKLLADGLLEKVTAAMGLDDAAPSTAVVTPKYGHPLREMLALIQDAIRHDNKLDIEYYTAATGRLETRRVWPRMLREGGAHLYLLAFCEQRSANRSFRLDRIKSVEVSGERFFPEPMDESALGGEIPGWDGTTTSGTFTVRLAPAVSREVLEDFEPVGGRWDELPDGSVDLTLPLLSKPWAIGWVLRFGCHAELLEPGYLRDELVRRVEAMLQQGID